MAQNVRSTPDIHLPHMSWQSKDSKNSFEGSLCFEKFVFFLKKNSPRDIEKNFKTFFFLKKITTTDIFFYGPF